MQRSLREHGEQTTLDAFSLSGPGSAVESHSVTALPRTDWARQRGIKAQPFETMFAPDSLVGRQGYAGPIS